MPPEHNLLQAKRGGLKDTDAVDLLSTVFKAVLDRTRINPGGRYLAQLLVGWPAKCSPVAGSAREAVGPLPTSCRAACVSLEAHAQETAASRVLHEFRAATPCMCVLFCVMLLCAVPACTDIGDIVVGSVLGPSSQRANEARIASFFAGIPEEVPVRTVNRWGRATLCCAVLFWLFSRHFSSLLKTLGPSARRRREGFGGATVVHCTWAGCSASDTVRARPVRSVSKYTAHTTRSFR